MLKHYLLKRTTNSFKILAVALCTIAVHVPAPAQEFGFLGVLERARAYDPSEPPMGREKDRRRSAELYRQAIALRPNHIENAYLEFRVGGMLLSMEDDKEAMLEGLSVFASALETYEHMDYYSAEPPGSEAWRQYFMVTMAIYAAGMVGEPEAERAHYFSGMEMLNETYVTRQADWLKEPSPPEPHELLRNEIEMRKWRSRVGRWERRQEAAKNGDVFKSSSYEKGFVESLIRLYLSTYQPLAAVQVEGVLRHVIESFPNSPFEKEALRLIEVAKDADD